MSNDFTDAELEAYLDEGLDPTRAAELEVELEKDRELLRRLSHINGRRDAGIHTLGEIWRRNQLGVPTREQMGNFILGVSSQDEVDYIKFRMEVLKCRVTVALHRDLTEQQVETDAEKSASRRSKIFQSSAGLLKKKEGKSDDQ